MTMMAPVATAMHLPLHDIADDHSLGWWPLALGWWLLLAAILLLSCGLWLWLRQRQRRLALNQQVVSLLSAPAQSISELNLRLKQVLLLKHSRQAIASMQEQTWLDTLVEAIPESQRSEFSSELSAYMDLRYRPQSRASVDSYQTLLLDWWALARPRFAKEIKNV